jgi:hypothetical protein
VNAKAFHPGWVSASSALASGSVKERSDLAPRDEGELFRQIAGGHRGDDPADAADLVGEVRGHHVDVAGELLPGSGNARNLRLSSELSFGADVLGDARDLGGKGS